MKKLALIVIGFLMLLSTLSSCKETKWEYTSVEIDGSSNSKFKSNCFEFPKQKLNKLSKDGWELVSTYTIIETVHPNFGNEDYVTGLQPNTRTSTVVFVLKRKVTE